jgi:two-component system alkaline phosphatase synthesis response regulator PhoP
LVKENFKVLQAFNGSAGLDMVKKYGPDLIILDIMLPGMDGFEVCMQLRQTSITPVLFLTARGEEIDRILGLELGADDYLAKPFSIRELLARIKAIFRRIEMVKGLSQLSSEGAIQEEDISIDRINHEVKASGKRVDLTPKEFQLLYLLVSNPGRVFSREFILDRIWGINYNGFDRSVDNIILNIRKKLGRSCKASSRISTVWGVGYKFSKKE